MVLRRGVRLCFEFASFLAVGFSVGCEYSVPRSEVCGFFAVAAVAQLVERVLGKDEVTGSNPVSSLPGRFLSSGCCVVLASVWI